MGGRLFSDGPAVSDQGYLGSEVQERTHAGDDARDAASRLLCLRMLKRLTRGSLG